MAPSNAANGLQQNRQRPTVPRVVPAIPLPYIQKRKQQEAARAKAREEAKAAVVVDTTVPSTPAVVEIPSPIANGSADREIAKAEEPAEPSVASTPAAPGTPVPESVKQDDVVEAPAVSAPAEVTEVTEQLDENLNSNTSNSPSDASRSIYHMPPPFIPGNSQFNGSDPTVQHAQFNGQYRPLHQAHPSAGSVMFGGYPESNNSSPQPQSGGFMPPPFPMQQMPQHGQSRHAPHLSNGGHSQRHPYSPMGPPPPPGYYPGHNGFMNHGPPVENFVRRPPGFGPMESHTLPDGGARFNNFDPATPHSFHGSQSSTTNEHENGPAFYNQYPPGATNGSNAHVEERLHQQRPKQRAGVQQTTPPMGSFAGTPMNDDDLDGLIPYLQSQFADPHFADYTLELRCADDPSPPVRIPGHKLIFARSPALKHIMTIPAQESSPDGFSSRTLLIETKDRFLRSDGFWMAVQRLYGSPLMEDRPLPTHLQNGDSAAPMPGHSQGRFDLALGYAAAGTLLGVTSVVTRGIEIAANLINWFTVEKALDFSLDGGFAPGGPWSSENHFNRPHRLATYGPMVSMMITHVLTFIVTAFPAGFELDTSVPDPTFYRRLPFVPEARGMQHPRLSLIKFGDHPSEDSVRSSNSNTVTLTLSRILINLPYNLLQYVLESPRLGNVQGWATAALRTKVMHQVIEEREKRRQKVYSSSVPYHDRQINFDAWEAVGWQESVVSTVGSEAAPSLRREWIGFEHPESSS